MKEVFYMTIWEKEEFIEKKLKELNAPNVFKIKCFQSNEVIEKVYRILSSPNPTLDKIYSLVGIDSKEEIKDYSTLAGPEVFVKKMILNRSRITNFNKYPYNIPLLQEFYELSFDKNVTFLVGDNGIGKSTLIEALAVKLELNAEGGTQNFNFSTNDTHSDLYECINLVTDISKPKNKFFFRAETFYNVATEIENLDIIEYYGGASLHDCSHGESFIQLIENKFIPKGLYILDEPEAALSPQNQMRLLCIIDKLAKKGSQFIISTHSPILITYREADIYDLNKGCKKVNYTETDTFNIYKSFINNPDKMQECLLDGK
jgi:predicted ATPase